MSLARQHAYRSSAAQILRELGGLAWVQGLFEQAHQFLAEALETLRQLDDQPGIADVLKNLGNLAAEQGQPEQAHRLYEGALDVNLALDFPFIFFISLFPLRKFVPVTS